MWSMYDELIEQIPEDIIVTDYNVASSWTKVETENSLGISITVRGYSRPWMYGDTIVGMKLRDVAALCKSWNFTEASIGLAAINAYFNTPEKFNELGIFDDHDLSKKDLKSRKEKDAFTDYANKVKGKNVAVIGHFPRLEIKLDPICNMSILERNPSMGDYPDSACEYILPEQDYVFVTGMTFINKTLSRLLQIMKDKVEVILVGPTVPVTPILFKYGITGISGFCVMERDEMSEIVKTGRNMAIFNAGRMVSLESK